MAITIDCLPNEILVKIFVLHQPPRIEGHDRGTKPEWRDACAWAPLMGVCRHWRAVALETPLLWQVVDVGNSTKWLELAIARTRDAVLELYFHSHRTGVEALLMLIMPHIHRVRKLLLPPMSLACLILLSPIHNETFPVLDELRLWVDEPQELRVAEYVPFDLSPSRLPALRVLHLQIAVVPWTAATMSRLRYLSLRSCSPLQPIPSFRQFLDVIEACSELEELELHHFISRFASSSIHESTRTIRLPKLRELVLGDAPDSIAHFIANVYIEETVTVRLEGWPAIIGDELQEGFQSLLPKNTSHLPVLRTLTEVWITLNIEDDQEIIGVVPRRSLPLTLSLSTKVDYTGWWSYHSTMLTEFAILFRDVRLQTLRVFLEPQNTQSFHTWIELFAAFPTLQHLEIHPGGDPVHVFMALSSLSAPTEGPQLSRPLCPNLRRLEMDYLEFSERQHRLMLIALRKRAALGIPKLEYVGLRYNEDGARKMRALVGDISDYVTVFDCSSSL
ncbi:hypothetical protein K466DRAFT_555400 [Polyporus arcularius HHB13444]|uniref:F-box domain-containing protein n=1 Tax=Polyporus arcularius HHB13444 TaxID=1314778 RepID=A0A5C3P0U0_9APHY|nr:hypothetical protein K466DRAFT_555400 [Polyporus arcularius HHB13444]